MVSLVTTTGYEQDQISKKISLYQKNTPPLNRDPVLNLPVEAIFVSLPTSPSPSLDYTTLSCVSGVVLPNKLRIF